MPELFFEFLSDTSSWLLVFLIPLIFWGWLVRKALNNTNKKDSFRDTVQMLHHGSFGAFYLLVLGVLLDKVSDWVGDRSQMSHAYIEQSLGSKRVIHLFGFNPFTAASYEKCLKLAFLYPLIGYFISWVLGGDGQIGNFDWLQLREKTTELPTNMRCLIFSTFLIILIGSTWLLMLWQGWRQQLFLVSYFFSIGALVSIIFNVKLWIILVMAFLAFIWLFIPTYLGGWLAALLVFHSTKVARMLPFKHAFVFAFTITLIFEVTMIFAFLSTNTNNPAVEDFGFFIDKFSFIFNIGLAFICAILVFFTDIGASAFVVAVIVALFFIFSNSDLDAISITFMLVIMMVLDGSFFINLDVMSIVVLVFIGFSFVFIQMLKYLSLKKNILKFFLLLYTLLALLIGYVSIYFIKDPTYLILLMFWLILPLINAPLDWLSLGVTRGLLQSVRSGQHSTAHALTWALLDVILALAFLFLLTAILVGATALGNGLAGKTLVDINAILSNVRANPSAPDQWWIYFMLLSTLVPTLVHFALAGGAATLWLPRKWRLKLADGLEQNTYKTFGAWAYLTFTPFLGFVVAPVAVMYILWRLVNANGAWLGMRLLDWADGLARVAASV